MFAKAILAFAIVAAVRAGAVAPAGYLGTASAYHVGAQAEQTVRGYGGFNTVSHQSKSVVSPHSHVTKSDTRYTNDAAYGYAAPALSHGYAAHGYAAPALAHHGYAAPALAHGYAGHGYAAPALGAHGYGAQVVSGHGYAAPLAHHGYAAAAPALAHGYAGHGYAAPALAHHGYAAAPLAHHAYAAPALSHGYAAKAVAAPVASYSFSRTYPAGTLAYAY